MQLTSARPSGVSGGRLLLSRSGLAACLGAVMCLTLVAFAILAAMGHDNQNGWVANGPWIMIAFTFAAVGVVLARREPRNSIGWILIWSGLAFMLTTDASAYLVLDYRVLHGQLPLGPLVVWLSPLGVTSFLAIGPPILLFPNGRPNSRVWAWTLLGYLVIGLLSAAFDVAATVVAAAGHQIRINAPGNLVSLQHPTGLAGSLEFVAGHLLVALVPFIVVWVLRLSANFRRSRGETRQQLKWLLGGAAVTAISVGVLVVASGLEGQSAGLGSSWAADLFAGLLVLGIAAFPIGMGVGILKYRLYDVDRIISRTLSYAIVTGLLVGVYAGLVTLATRALPFSSPLGVAASTLAAVALFNPLRKRVQRLVDRRFNRARYDAEATIASFAQRLRNDLDLDAVSSALVNAVESSVEPAHVSLWMRATGS